MLRTVYTNYLRKISKINFDTVAGAIKAAANISDLSKEAPYDAFFKEVTDHKEMPCRIQNNCKSDLYLNESDYEGRGALMTLMRALRSGNKGE